MQEREQEEGERGKTRDFRIDTMDKLLSCHKRSNFIRFSHSLDSVYCSAITVAGEEKKKKTHTLDTCALCLEEALQSVG